MFSHVMLGSNDIARSKTFYDALFQAPIDEALPASAVRSHPGRLPCQMELAARLPDGSAGLCCQALGIG